MKDNSADPDSLELRIFSQIKKFLSSLYSFRRGKEPLVLLDLLKEIVGALRLVIRGEKNLLFDLSKVAQIQIEHYFRVLGLGELCIFHPKALTVYAAQQTAFPGVWWVEKKERKKESSSLHIEVGMIPHFVLSEREERTEKPDLKALLCSLGSSGISLQAFVSSLVNYAYGERADREEKKIYLSLLPLSIQDIKTLFWLLPKTDFTLYSLKQNAWVFGTPWKNIWWIEEVTDPEINQKSLGLLVCPFPYSLFPGTLDLSISARRLEKMVA
ncbi:hydrogenase [Candidatus Methylacidiphilum infernorum]|uniref:Hydrogenase n=1 Tax=Candidatus Methylacidiphilum infernorum TaxID=511746 RepID=A0ABX7PW02_9BACT|nr:hydrogenase expression/formation C-terminal domain-containing protein [Candidatus Methylacidiphilum infernorum]QSR87171.1 hydrogenase [Candidatus Methylacidiphilum infernorum]